MSLFRRRTLVIIIGLCAVSILSAVLFMVLGDEIRKPGSADANSYSRSAIGHRAFVEVLEELEIPVLVSRFDTRRKAEAVGGVLVLAEPIAAIDMRGMERFAQLISSADPILVVLPKWQGVRDPDQRDWIASRQMRLDAQIEEVLSSLSLAAVLVRPADGAPSGWQGTLLSHDPDLPGPQLLKQKTEQLDPLIECDQGILVGEMRHRHNRVVVLSDPDLISNHGIARGSNVDLAVGIIEEIRGADGVVIFDETLHGFELAPSLLRELCEFPLVLVPMQLLLALLALLAATTARFGAPLTPPPPIARGRQALIENTSELLLAGGHTARALERYFETNMLGVAERLHAPGGLDRVNLCQWLDQVGATHGIEERVASLRSAVQELRRAPAQRELQILQTAHRIHRWREVMTHGNP